jgi:hypothetical protein
VSAASAPLSLQGPLLAHRAAPTRASARA